MSRKRDYGFAGTSCERAIKAASVPGVHSTSQRSSLRYAKYLGSLKDIAHRVKPLPHLENAVQNSPAGDSEWDCLGLSTREAARDKSVPTPHGW